MRETAPRLEQPLAAVAVGLVLLHRVVDGLLRQAVLQLEGGDREAVHEEREVERQPAPVAVSQLPGHRETVAGVEDYALLVPRRGYAVEECDRVGAVLHAVPQHFDDAALLYFRPEAREELPADRGGVVRFERGVDLRLRRVEERRELRPVHAELGVVVDGVAADPAPVSLARFGDLSGGARRPVRRPSRSAPRRCAARVRARSGRWASWVSGRVSASARRARRARKARDSTEPPGSERPAADATGDQKGPDQARPGWGPHRRRAPVFRVSFRQDRLNY